MSVFVYVEGGGRRSKLRTECRDGFQQFFRKAGFQGRMPKIVACGSRETAFKDFKLALKNHDENRFNVLLVDSEAPVVKGISTWEHLQNQDRWDKPEGVSDDSAQLMVQCMEAWFLADTDNLGTFFGQGFNRQALPKQQKIEDISKADLLAAIKEATRQCKIKGKYSKRDHSFDILRTTDPAKVSNHSIHAEKLIDAISIHSK